MNKHPVLGGNNDGGECLPQQNESNSSRNPEVDTNPPQSTPPTAVPRTTNRSIFHKTRPCYSFIEGNCHNGDGCRYAHGSEDLRQPPPNWQKLQKDAETIGRMGICWKFYNGEECPYGEICGFLHENPAKFEDERHFSHELVKDTETIGRSVGICWKFYYGEECPFGETCKFLHENLEKLGICWKFYNGEECPYGETCKFLHENPAKLQPTEMETSVRRIVSEGQARPPNFLHENPTKFRGETAMEMRRKRSESTVMKIPTVVSQQQREARGFAKLANKKLKGIYGDWINEEEDE